MDLCESWIAAWMIAKVEAANAVEVQKKVFPKVSTRTVQRRLKEQGLLCHVQKSKPYLTEVHRKKWQLWAMQHIGWTVEDWKWVIFLDESKFMLFKSDRCQYCYIKPGQALDDHFIKKNIKHGTGNLMVWGCITGWGMGRLHCIKGIMCGLDWNPWLGLSWHSEGPETEVDWEGRIYFPTGQWPKTPVQGCQGLVSEEKH